MTLLKIQDLHYAYPRAAGAHAFRLDGVSLEVRPGEAWSLLGPNGSGKSTLFRLLLRSLKPSAGRIELSGRPLADYAQRELARLVAWVPQDADVAFPTTVEETVALGRYAHRASPDRHAAVVEEALRRTDLVRFRRRPVGALSGGERRRVLLARALAQEPMLLLLDEPTTHLDLGHQADFVRLIDEVRRERSLAVFAVLHDVNLAAAWCPNALVLRHGRPIAQGASSKILTADLLRRIWGLAHARGPDGGPFVFFSL